MFYIFTFFLSLVFRSCGRLSWLRSQHSGAHYYSIIIIIKIFSCGCYKRSTDVQCTADGPEPDKYLSLTRWSRCSGCRTSAVWRNARQTGALWRGRRPSDAGRRAAGLRRRSLIGGHSSTSRRDRRQRQTQLPSSSLWRRCDPRCCWPRPLRHPSPSDRLPSAARERTALRCTSSAPWRGSASAPRLVMTVEDGIPEQLTPAAAAAAERRI